MTIETISNLTDEAIARLTQAGKIVAEPIGYPDSPRETGVAFALLLAALASVNSNSAMLIPTSARRCCCNVDLATFHRSLELLAETVALYRRLKLVVAYDDIYLVPFGVDLQSELQAGEKFA